MITAFLGILLGVVLFSPWLTTDYFLVNCRMRLYFSLFMLALGLVFLWQSNVDYYTLGLCVCMGNAMYYLGRLKESNERGDD